MADGRIHLAIPATGAYRKLAEVTARSAARGASLPVEVHYLDWTNVDRARMERFGNWHGSAIAWSRLFLAEILPTDVDWVVSCDADVLFRGDIAKLWALRDERCLVQMSRDSQPPWRTLHPAVEAWLGKSPGVRPGEVLCSGLTLVNLRRWREEGWQSRVEDFLRRHSDAPFLDQMALNVVFRDCKAPLPQCWGCFSGDANADVDYDGDCAIHYVGDPPWRLSGPTRLMSDAVVLWRREAGLPCGGWRRALWLVLRRASALWRWNGWMAWRFRTACVSRPGRCTGTILHVVPGLDDPGNGIAVAAKLLARSQGADLVDARNFGRSAVRAAGRCSEVWVHSMWLPQTMRACRRVIRMPRAFVRLDGRPKLVRMTHGNLDPVRLGYHGWKKRLVGPIERRLLRRCDRIVATCEAEEEWIRAYVGKECPEIVVEDLKRFFSLPAAACGRAGVSRDRALHLLYLGRRHPLKGTECLEKAVAGLDVELRIVSAAFGDEKDGVWNWCDVLVLPTLSENFGLVVAEALERGKCVVTTDGAPAWEGQAGVLYLRGYRNGTDEQRVAMLRQAIGGLLK